MPAPASDQLGELARDFNRMAVSLERLHEEEQVKQRLDSEIEMGRSIQMHLYPRAPFTFRNTTVAGKASPARIVGGDLYDFFKVDEDCIGILGADISGKGVPAALMMANVQAIANACRIRAEFAKRFPAGGFRMHAEPGNGGPLWGQSLRHAVLGRVRSGQPVVEICERGQPAANSDSLERSNQPPRV